MDEDKIRAFEDALDDLSNGSFDAAQTLNDLSKAGNQNLTYLEKSEKAWNDYFRERPLARMAKDTVKFTGQLGKAFIESGMAARENRESFDALKPVISAVSAVFKAIPIAGSGLSEAFSGVANFVVDEVQKTVTAYQTLGNVGATTAGGMSAMRDQAIQAGLSFQQFSDITKNNSESLAFFGGSTARGMKELAAVTQAAKPLQTEFLNLGIGISEQSEIFAEYLGMSQRLGRNQQGDYNAQAESAKRYIMQLDELARITGKTRDEAQKDLDAQLSNTRFRATLMQMEAEGRTTEAENLRTYVASLPKDMQQGAMDLVGGAATEAGRQVEIALGGEGSQIFAGLKSGAIDATEAIARAQEAASAQVERLGLDYFARAAGLGGPLDGVANSLLELTTRVGFTRGELEKTLKEQAGAAKTQDDATKKVVEAQQSMQEFAKQMDIFIQNNVFPKATEAIAGLTGSLASLATTINKTIDNLGGEDNEPSWWEKTMDKLFGGGSSVGNLDTSELDFAAADGDYVTKGQVGLVGEKGPELFAPDQNGQILSNKDIQSRLAAIQYGGRDSDTLTEGTKQTFMPGIGTVSQFKMGPLTNIIIENLKGEIEKFSSASFLGVTQGMYSAGGQKYQRMSAQMDGVTASTGFAPSGPRSYYDSIMDSVSPRDLSVQYSGNAKRGGGPDVTGQISSQELVSLFSEMKAEMAQVAANTRQGADTSKQILRATSS